MKIYDDIYTWEGWGGKLKLGSGRCRMRIFDVSRRRKDDGVAHLKPVFIVVSDIPFDTVAPNQMTVKGVAGHIASQAVKDFGIDPHRMRWIEYYPAAEDENLRYSSGERFDEVVFTWRDEDALYPGWKPVSPAMHDLIKELLEEET